MRATTWAERGATPADFTDWLNGEASAYGRQPAAGCTPAPKPLKPWAVKTEESTGSVPAAPEAVATGGVGAGVAGAGVPVAGAGGVDGGLVVVVEPFLGAGHKRLLRQRAAVERVVLLRFLAFFLVRVFFAAFFAAAFFVVLVFAACDAPAAMAGAATSALISTTIRIRK